MTKNFFCRGALGDIIYCLPTIISLGGGRIYLRKEKHLNMLKSLLEKQSYIINCELEYAGVKIDHNLDAFRPINRNNRSIHLSKCSLMAQKVAYDISETWLENIEPKYIGEIVINRSLRYHDRETINWKQLKNFNCVFIGTKQEHEVFCNNYFLLPYHRCVDGLEIASVIKGSNFFVGNSSFPYAISEALKHKRVLEVCYNKPSCLPQGYNGYIDIHEDLIKGINETTINS